MFILFLLTVVIANRQLYLWGPIEKRKSVKGKGKNNLDHIYNQLSQEIT